MTNGSIEESIKGEAMLPGVEPEIFEQLFKFAYLGLCGMSDGLVGSPASSPANSPANSPPSKFSCHKCGTPRGSSKSSKFHPFCQQMCRETYEDSPNQIKQLGWNSVSYTASCVGWRYDSTIPMTQDSTPVLCPAHDNARNHSIYPEVAAGMSKVDKFLSLRYGAVGLSHTDLNKLLETHEGVQFGSPRLTHYAKLYALTSQYLVTNLRYICLHKLHRHLANFVPPFGQY